MAIPFVATEEDSSHVLSKARRANKFIECVRHIHQQVDEILDLLNAKYKQQHDQNWVAQMFQVGDKV